MRGGGSGRGGSGGGGSGGGKHEVRVFDCSIHRCEGVVQEGVSEGVNMRRKGFAFRFHCLENIQCQC